jgi:hypothetical protein
MKYPEFRLPYMAMIGMLASHLDRPFGEACMTHLSWDENEPRVLEGRVFRANRDARHGARAGSSAGSGLGDRPLGRTE